MDKNWNFLCDKLLKKDIAETSARLGVSQVFSVILLNREVKLSDISELVYCDFSKLYDPFLLKDMEIAVSEINKSISEGDKITVYGDYDVDGIASVVMLVRYLRSRGAQCDAYIPDRESEGYGLNCEAIKKISENGTNLIITVDNGITATAEAEYVKTLGLKMIITDHHACGENLPDAIAVVNPKRNECQYPFRELSGAGVCFKLLCALDGNTEKIASLYSEYVSIATIADVVSLKDENRILAKIGIKKIRNEKIPWVDALLDTSSIEKEKTCSYHIGFMIAPRINAAGRIGTADIALKLMFSDDFDTAYEYAEFLNSENCRRKEIGDKIFKEAIEIIENGDYKDKKVIVLAKEHWHQGVIGITASRIADIYHKNVFLLSVCGDIAKGSARSVPGFNLYDALTECSCCLSKFGGHDMAAGLTIFTDKIEEFEEKVNLYADNVLNDENMVPSINIDCRLSCEGSLVKLCHEINKLEPFGTGNTKPVFAIMNAKIRAIRLTRDGKHLLVKFVKNNVELSAIGFGMAEEAKKISVSDVVNIAGKLELNEYLGNITPQVHIVDIKAVENVQQH